MELRICRSTYRLFIPLRMHDGMSHGWELCERVDLNSYVGLIPYSGEAAYLSVRRSSRSCNWAPFCNRVTDEQRGRGFLLS